MNICLAIHLFALGEFFFFFFFFFIYFFICVFLFQSNGDQ